MTRGELLRRMSSRELSQWMVFYQIEPWGAEANMLGHAITASTIANAHRGKRGKRYEPKDFIPKFDRPKKQTTQDMINFAAMMTKMMGGKDLRANK